MARRQLLKDELQITFVDSKSDRWRFQDREVNGTVSEYDVLDNNFTSWKRWKFIVRVPERLYRYDYIEVRPKEHPALKCWTGIEQTSMNFARGTLPGYRTTAYVKVKPADVTQPRKTVHIVRGERDILPPWMDQFCMRLKETVTTTRGYDGRDQVAIVNILDYAEMIRLFFALRVWVLRKSYQFWD